MAWLNAPGGAVVKGTHLARHPKHPALGQTGYGTELAPQPADFGQGAAQSHQNPRTGGHGMAGKMPVQPWHWAHFPVRQPVLPALQPERPLPWRPLLIGLTPCI